MFRFSVLIVIIAAITFQLKLIYQPQDGKQNPEVESAIRRAKTLACKEEIRKISDRIFSEQSQQQILKRRCRLDTNESRIRRVGCVTNSTGGLTKVDETIENSQVCLDLCFAFGHSFAGFDANSRECFCGDDNHQEGTASCRDIDWFQVDFGLHNHRRRTSGEKAKAQRNVSLPDNNQVRIAFLIILNGRSNLQIQRLLKNIYSKRHLYYLHVDSRDEHLYNELSALEGRYVNIILAKKRFSTIWGGPDLLRMMIDAFGWLSSYEWDYLINLSGSDFPIKPLDALEDYLQNDNEKMIYLRSHNIKGYNFIKKQALDINFYQCEDRVWRLGKREFPKGIIFHGGSDWYALPRDFCLYIWNNLAEPNSLVKPLVQLYNFTLLPAESFFHTLALNSEFCDRFANFNLRLTNWKRRGSCKCQHRDVVDWCGCSPLIYRKSEWPKLKQTNHSSSKLFFSRKFDPTVSVSIIDEVEKRLVRRDDRIGDVQQGNQLWYWQDLYYSDNTTRLNFLAQFGMFALIQIRKTLDIDPLTNYALKSVHEYFNQDRFQGLIFNYCDSLDCFQFLVEKIPTANAEVDDSHCRLETGGRRMKTIEVNHGFDAGEKMFRNYLPLNYDSDLVVFNEWILNQSWTTDETGAFLFSLINPEGRLELKQKIKIKSTPKRIKYSLAQRLKVTKPMKSGLWTLKVASGNKKSCLNYKFLVFDNRTFRDGVIQQEVYDKFFRVTSVCVVARPETNLTLIVEDCLKKDWSLSNLNMYKMP